MRIRVRTSRGAVRAPEPEGRRSAAPSDGKTEQRKPLEGGRQSPRHGGEPGMHLKSFFAATIEAALAEGGRELGPEALIVQSRRTPAEWRHLGECEVVLAVAAAAPATASRAASGERSPGADDPLARELAELRRQLDGMRRS